MLGLGINVDCKRTLTFEGEIEPFHGFEEEEIEMKTLASSIAIG